MDITCEKPQGDTLKEFVKVFWTAFEPPEADMIMPMIFPNGFTPELSDSLVNMLQNRITNDPHAFFILARDSQSKDLVGVSSWTMRESSLSTKDEIDQAYEAERAKSTSRPTTTGMNEALGAAQYRAGFYAERTTMLGNNGEPYGVLSILAVHPGHHRRGIAGSILKQGLARFDAQHMPTYLDCGVQGKPLYEKHGFEVVKDYPLDAREYGGRSEVPITSSR